jgi:hypothetical protein
MKGEYEKSISKISGYIRQQVCDALDLQSVFFPVLIYFMRFCVIICKSGKVTCAEKSVTNHSYLGGTCFCFPVFFQSRYIVCGFE